MRAAAYTTAIILLTFAVAAESPGPGRSENPDEGGGLAIILGIAFGVIAIALLMRLVILPRVGKRRPKLHREEHPPGRVGRTS